MIFVTVGHQMPFDRLIRLVDRWASAHPEKEMLAQIGDATYDPVHMPSVASLSPRAFDSRMQQAEVVLAHAGTGTIIRALEFGKPILVMPRRAKFGETRSDHQVATARWFENQAYLRSFNDEVELSDLLEVASPYDGRVSSVASGQLMETLSRFIVGESAVRRD